MVLQAAQSRWCFRCRDFAGAGVRRDRCDLGPVLGAMRPVFQV